MTGERPTSGLPTAPQSAGGTYPLVPWRGEARFTFAARNSAELNLVLNAISDALDRVGAFYEVGSVQSMTGAEVIPGSPLANLLQADRSAGGNPGSSPDSPTGVQR